MKKILSVILSVLLLTLAVAAETVTEYFYDPDLQSEYKDPVDCVGTELGGYFKFENGSAVALTVRSGPTWNGKGDTYCEFDVYKWKGDYHSTVSASPLFTVIERDHADNAPYEIGFPTALEAGEYLWVMKNAESDTGKMGIWLEYDEPVTVSFIGGNTASGDFQISLTLDMTVSDPLIYETCAGERIPAYVEGGNTPVTVHKNLFQLLKDGGSFSDASLSVALMALSLVFFVLAAVILLLKRRSEK